MKCSAEPEVPTRMGPAEVAYAVLCGCDTAHRLSIEWDIHHKLASSLLAGAVEARLVVPTDGQRFLCVFDADKHCQ